MRTRLSLALGILVIVGGLVALIGRPSAGSFDLVVASQIEIEPIRLLRDGFLQEFRASSFARTHKFTVREVNAQGDPGLINQIADQIATSSPDAVYVLGTTLAQAIQKRAPGILLVQGAVTDPVSAGLADSWSGSGKRYVANSDLPPIRLQLDLIRALQPDIRSLGVLYNPGETNSAAVLALLRAQSATMNPAIRLVDATVAGTSDVARSMTALVGRVEAVYVPPDNTVHGALAVVGEIAKSARLPFYATTESALESGAVAAMSLDFQDAGREAADMMLEVLAGARPDTMAIRVPRTPSITVNGDVAETLGLNTDSLVTWPNLRVQ